MVRTKVFVGNLSFQTKEAELADEFETAGKVISANIITRGPRSLGYGFVEMDSEEDAAAAVKVMNKKEVNGRPINVEIAKPQDETKERKPRPPKVEGGGGGTVGRRPPRRRPTRRPSEEEEGEDLQDEGGERRRPRRRDRHRVVGQKRVPTEDKIESKTTLFVANLPFSLDDDAFSKVVTDLNLKLKTAHVVKKRNGRSKGYGFIEFDHEEEQQKALGVLNKKVVDSREISVKVALTEKKTEENEQDEKEAKPVSAVKPVEKKVPVEKKTTPAPAPTSTPAHVEKEVEKKVTPATSEKKPTPSAAATTEKKFVEKKDEKKDEKK